MSYESGFNTGLAGLMAVNNGFEEGRQRKRQQEGDAMVRQRYADQQAQQSQQDGVQKLGRVAAYLLAIPDPQQRAAAYSQALPTIGPIAQSLGLPPAPQVWDESHLPELQMLAQIGGQGGASDKPMNVSPGGAIVDPRTGKEIYANTNFAPRYDSARGGFADPNGGFNQVAPARPDYEAQRLAIAQQANERAAQAAQDAADTRRRAQWGTAPAGQRFNAQGVLEAIPGYVAPLSAVERREQAARRARMPQVANLDRGMERIDKALAGIDNSLAKFGGINTGPIDQMVMGKLPAGQELEAAVGGIQNSLLSLTRVPGIGSQSDLEARIAMLQYPSLDKPPEVNRRTLENLKAFVADLKAAYTAASEGDQPEQAQSASAPKVQEGTVIVNRQTGHRQVLRGGKWVDL